MGYCRWNKNSRRLSNSFVRSWETDFYTKECGLSVSSLKWAKTAMSIYENVAKWDDSGALEALRSAKARYWAKINNLPFNDPLPDPEMYVEEVDYDTYIDPELLADLEKEPPPPPPETEKAETVEIPIVPTGWGDLDDPPKTTSYNENTSSNNYGSWKRYWNNRQRRTNACLKNGQSSRNSKNLHQRSSFQTTKFYGSNKMHGGGVWRPKDTCGNVI